MSTRIDFSALSIAERLDLIGEIGDSVDQIDLPPPSAQMLAELERRASEAERDQQGGTPWSDIRNDLFKRR